MLGRAMSDRSWEEVEEADENVDEMKIQTMYKMVDDCRVSIGGRETTKKVLYLTNKQAALFDDAAMERCLQALDIGDPKFIIMLSTSGGVRSQMMKAHAECIGTPTAEWGPDGDMDFMTAEIDVSDERAVESQLLIFMRTCVLPVAMQTRALIIISGANDCFLGAALSDVALGEQVRLGKDCPFTVVATVYEHEVHYLAVRRGSLACQIAKQSQSWRNRLNFTSQFWKTINGGVLQQCDLSPAASRYIVFESIDEARDEVTGGFDVKHSKKNVSLRASFETVFLQMMTRKLPSIAIQSHYINKGLQYLVDLASRNIPVLLLDTRERAITSRRAKTRLSTLLAEKSDAFPKIPVETLEKIEVDDETSLTIDSRHELLRIAEQMVEREWKVLTEHHTACDIDTAELSFFHAVLMLGSQIKGSSNLGANPDLYAKIRDLERLERTNKDSNKALIPPELVTRVIEYILTKIQAYQTIARLAHIEHWLEDHDPDMDHLIEEAIQHRDMMRKRVENIKKKGGIVSESTSTDVWLDYYDILTSNNTHSGSVFDCDELKRIMGSVAKIDRLPDSDTLEALRTIQDAWDYVETYHMVADNYKIVTKLAYFVIILMGIAIVFLNISSFVYNFDARTAIIVLSFVTTLLVGYVSFMNPAVRWQQLRMAALQIESNIWMFRTRAGKYRSNGEGFDHSAEKLLVEELQNINSIVLEGADIKGTSFYSRGTSKNLHNQHNPSIKSFGAIDYFLKNNQSPPLTKQDQGKKEEERKTRIKTLPIYDSATDVEVPLTSVVTYLRDDDDDYEAEANDSHYEPLQPDSYIRFRIIKAMNFYKARIPVSYRIRVLAQFFLLLGSIATGALAFFGEAAWASAATIIASGISGFLEFDGTVNKINRYSTTIQALHQTILWWQTLPQIEKSVTSNIDTLIITCEDILQREQQAWKSTTQAVKMLAKAAKDDSAGSDGGSD